MKFRSSNPEEDRGESSIMGPIIGGAVASLLIGIHLTGIRDKIDDSNFISPDKLEVVSFSPEPGVECSGLSLDGSKIIISTVVCDFSPEG